MNDSSRRGVADRPARVLFFTAFAAPHKGGVERYSLALARRLVARGLQVTIVTCNTEGAAAEETIDGVRLIRLPAWTFVSRQFPIPRLGRRTLRVLRELRQSPPDIVGTYTRFYVTALLGYFFARRVRRPLYHLERGSRTYAGPSAAVNVVAWIVDRTWGRMILRRADRVYAASEEVRTFVRALGNRDALLLGPRVDASVFRPDAQVRETWRKRLHLTDEQIAMIFCGRLVRTKGVVDLDAAFAEVRDERAV